MYADITQENLTTELVTYRRDWFNKGDTPFITYRDYCEWICIYAHDDTYQADRGDMAKEMQDQMGGATGDTGDTGTNEEQLKTTDGWLTLEAFAVWKRMEKYENNVEYIAKSGDYTPKQSAITEPILKRQISTTVFPWIHDSGNQTVDPDTGKVTNDKYTIQTNIGPDDMKVQSGDTILDVYDWINGSGSIFPEYKDNHDFDKHLRRVYDRFEYNECYNKFDSVNRDGKKEELIKDSKFAKSCIHALGACDDHTHAKYNISKWVNRYGYEYSPDAEDDLVLPLDEDTYDFSATYLQFYIPYDTFKMACQKIKASYTQSGKEKGYANYMKYWARNGTFTDICDLTAYPHTKSPSGQQQYRFINNTYLSTDFWSVYDGTKDPATGDKWSDKAVGW